MRLDRHLVAFAREPRLGRVKTRLAAGIGTVAAWTFYRRTAARVLRPLLTDRRWHGWLAVTPDQAAGSGSFASWPGWRLAQGGGDLGQRMARMMVVMPPGPVVIVGTDAPDLHTGHVAEAFRLLGRHDAVFGPAADGGYWLVGLRRGPRALDIFDGVRWSTEHTLADTLANLPRNATAAMLEELLDIDDSADLARWQDS